MATDARQLDKPRWPFRLAVTTGVVVAVYAAGLGVQAGLIEYVQRILLLAGINVILAVGLNLINGTTGQFSIGHAGFMAVGAYGSAFVGTQLAPLVAGALGQGALADAVTFNLALVVGALLAALAGVLVGLPSLRLRGDYLAIVTLGFGEIIRILFNNAHVSRRAPPATSATRPPGFRTYTSFFWVYLWAIAIIVVIRNVDVFADGALARRDSRGRDRRRGHGDADHAPEGVGVHAQRGGGGHRGRAVRAHAVRHPPRRLQVRKVDRHDRDDHRRRPRLDLGRGHRRRVRGRDASS